MSPDLMLAFMGFAVVNSITPGPNNMMLMASGVNFGFRRTMPHLAGVNLGFMLMMLLVGLGLGQIFARFPIVYASMKVLGALYLLWLAWKIARSGPIEDGEAVGQPMTFLQAAAFQWVNPKAWAMVIGAIAAFTEPSAYVMSVLAITALYLIGGTPSSFVWVVFGTAMRRLLRHPRQVVWFNRTMALLLVLSLWPIISDLIPR
jgi:threonine/homoserine/homoserine lactone efflux protein